MKRSREFKNPQLRTQQAFDGMREELEMLSSELNELARRNRSLISILGAVNVSRRDSLYKHARQTAYHLGCEGHDTLTGGGPGIMEAVNSGVQGGTGRSIAIADEKFQSFKPEIPYTKKLVSRHHILRRHALLTTPDALVFYPGAKGTLDELLNAEMYLQEEIMEDLPVFLVQSRINIGTMFDNKDGKPYWEALERFCKAHMNGYSAENGLRGKIVNIEDTTGKQFAEEIIKAIGRQQS